MRITGLTREEETHTAGSCNPIAAFQRLTISHPKQLALLSLSLSKNCQYEESKPRDVDHRDYALDITDSIGVLDRVTFAGFWVDFITCGQFAWDAAVLGHLYSELRRVCTRNCAATATCWTLLQLWAWERFPAFRPDWLESKPDFDSGGDYALGARPGVPGTSSRRRKRSISMPCEAEDSEAEADSDGDSTSLGIAHGDNDTSGDA
ncbi:hypothetical protein J5N97_005289 [Dioscorea zingiberensis]|uniref:Aminotransferase-like plant mobile domain-containing protein n=1 Tax=Dioscorea zingiberensis TaxID=325984 RepID=A0A9D5D9X5_9LILI|nr:hypothetical protein J5N97_005289 [Dioscorea zingiberensis]